MNEPRKIKRGSVQRQGSIFIGAWVPQEKVELIDQAIKDLDSDRSKFLRLALQEKVQRERAAVVGGGR